MKSDQWKEDRELLRKIARENKMEPLEATVIYSLISHMRGKLHMHSYAKYHSGWRNKKRNSQLTYSLLSDGYEKAYGTEAKYYYARCVLETLEDQEEFIRQHVAALDAGSKGFACLPERVLDGYPELEEEEIRTASVA